VRVWVAGSVTMLCGGTKSSYARPVVASMVSLGCFEGVLLDSDGQGTMAVAVAWLAPWLAEMEVSLIGNGKAMSLCSFIYTWVVGVVVP
jgi:hypothetical protein